MICSLFPLSRCLALFVALGVSLFACVFLSSCTLVGVAASAGLMKMQFGCLPEGTLIDSPSGAVAVEEISAGDRVTGYDGSVVVVRQVHQYQEDPAASRHLAVQFLGSDEIQLSPRHRIAGIPAGDLKPGDRVGERIVSSVRPVSGISRSFDLLTDDRGYRIRGIPVNSMIEEMTGR